MKKTFLLILTIILTLGTVFSLSACKKKNKQNEVDISKNVSYAETHRYVGENEDFNERRQRKTFHCGRESDGCN